MNIHHRNLRRVVIIGGGFGGLEAAKALRKAGVRVTVLDRQNHHLFQPLLYQVAAAALSPADIAEPLRHILRNQENAEVILTEVKSIETAHKRVITADGPVEYDYLIVAAGARHSYFGRDDWEKFAPGLKSLDDALNIRQRMLMAFEIAEKTEDDAEREAAMTFVVVGGGPTGVEMSGAIAEIARVTLIKDFRHIDSSEARVFLIESGPEILQAFSGELSESGLKQLTGLGVEVRLNKKVEAITEAGVTLTGGEKIAANTVVWAAGNAASPLGTSLGVPLDRPGRVIVNEDCSIPGHAEVFVIGDQAHFAIGEGRLLPGLSPVAMQQGRHVARNIVALLRGQPTSRFEYHDKGSMATIGRNAAVAEMGSIRISGFVAWLAWLFVHIIFLVGFRNRIAVLFNWAYAYLTYGRGARLITSRQTGNNGAAEPPKQ
ncbi:MAG: NAD(P)/FAD-dependent oxidoreductase [Chthoniobacteraceae bacterium]